MSCMRNLSHEKITEASKSGTDEVYNPIKLVLEPGFGPVVDGTVLSDQIINNVRNGVLRKNTPISWNYAQNDAWSFTGGSFRAMERVLADKGPEFSEANKFARENDIRVPSDFLNQWIEKVTFEFRKPIKYLLNKIVDNYNRQF